MIPASTIFTLLIASAAAISTPVSTTSNTATSSIAVHSTVQNDHKPTFTRLGENGDKYGGEIAVELDRNVLCQAILRYPPGGGPKIVKLREHCLRGRRDSKSALKELGTEHVGLMKRCLKDVACINFLVSFMETKSKESTSPWSDESAESSTSISSIHKDEL